MPMIVQGDDTFATLALLRVEPIGSAPAVERKLRSVYGPDVVLDAIEVRFHVPREVCVCGLAVLRWDECDGWSRPLDHCESWRTSTPGRLDEAGVDLAECHVEGVGCEWTGTDHRGHAYCGSATYLEDIR